MRILPLGNSAVIQEKVSPREKQKENRKGKATKEEMVSNAIDVAKWDKKRQIAGPTCFNNRRAKSILEKEKIKAKLRKERTT